MKILEKDYKMRKLHRNAKMKMLTDDIKEWFNNKILPFVHMNKLPICYKNYTETSFRQKKQCSVR
jgi:hypothetical protein